jgi:hypothetical protein
MKSLALLYYTLQLYNKVKNIATDKRSSLFCNNAIDEEKKFNTMDMLSSSQTGQLHHNQGQSYREIYNQGFGLVIIVTLRFGLLSISLLLNGI